MNTGNNSNSTHTYNNYGAFTYSLKVTTGAGCVLTITKPDYIKIAGNSKNDAHWTAVPNHTNLDVKFKNDSTHLKSYAWNFGDGHTAANVSPLHTYSMAHTYLVSLVTANSFGCKDTFDSTIVVVGPPPGVNEKDRLLPGLAVYPNPFSGMLTIVYDLDAKKPMKITLLDITGKELAVVADAVQVAGEHRIGFDPSAIHLQPGIYLLRFSMPDGETTRQIVYRK
jgi:PKD repeat protein